MALGISGSNGGFGRHYHPVTIEQITSPAFYLNKPLEISYFVNNICNLSCSHCYVGYKHKKDDLSSKEWEQCFSELIALGARTFGNVGKEPLVNWELTRGLLQRFAAKRHTVQGLRFGLVTNGTLMDERKRRALAEIEPDYIDISLDGVEHIHDVIRGTGAFRKTIDNLSSLPESVKQRVFISFTLNRQNEQSLTGLIQQLYAIGIRQFLISPYVCLQNEGDLYLPDADLVSVILRLLGEELANFGELEGARFYVKSDFTTTRGFMNSLVVAGAIDVDRLYCDEYGAVFNRYDFSNDVTVYLNYYGQDPSFLNALRISHDGYFSRCLDMFYSDYPLRSVGNIRQTSAQEMLQMPSNCQHGIGKNIHYDENRCVLQERWMPMQLCVS